MYPSSEKTPEELAIVIIELLDAFRLTGVAGRARTWITNWARGRLGYEQV